MHTSTGYRAGRYRGKVVITRRRRVTLRSFLWILTPTKTKSHLMSIVEHGSIPCPKAPAWKTLTRCLLCMPASGSDGHSKHIHYDVLMAGYERRCHMRSFLAEVAPSHKTGCPGWKLFLARKETVTSTAHGCEGPLKTIV